MLQVLGPPPLHVVAQFLERLAGSPCYNEKGETEKGILQGFERFLGGLNIFTLVCLLILSTCSFHRAGVLDA